MGSLYALIAFIVGFLIAQVIKLVTIVVKKRGEISGKEIFRLAMKSGGMPSGHSASFAAMTMYFGLAQGFTSAIFVLAVCVSLIIIYDAVNVRYAVGEHGKLLVELSEKQGTKKRLDRVVEGHTVSQVIVGVLIGIGVGAAVYGIFG